MTRDAIRDALAAVGTTPVPAARACLDLARAFADAGEPRRAAQWAFAATDAAVTGAGSDFATWLGANRVWRSVRADLPPAPRRAKVAVLGSYTTTQLTQLLPLACARAGVEVEVHECGYGQFRTELLDPTSALHAFDPDVVVLAVDAAAVDLPATSEDPEAAVEAELANWTRLWDLATARFGARVVQHGVVLPADVALGHLAVRTPGSRYAVLQRFARRLGEEAGARAAQGIGVVDCERLAATVGKRNWTDPRYVHAAKQSVALGAVPLLAQHTAAVIGAQLGRSRKCLVLDLDGTLWGGVLGEVGPHGIEVGHGARGEAFSAFQRYVLDLKAKGVVLAVSSKNDEAHVREAFERNPDVLVRLDDIAVLKANWDDKPTAVREIAATLGIGEDALVFVDDNPAEREAVRDLVPGVDVVALPAEPSGYVAALAAYPFFETDALTAEDTARTAQYRARARAVQAREQAGTLEEYLASLDMHAEVSALGPENLARVVQLLGKTNQFNLTTRRHSHADVEAVAADPAWTTFVVRVRDRFADHGIVAVLLARREGDVLDVDSWLMSCRVIGRTLEDEVFAVLVGAAEASGARTVRGTYVPTAKNAQVAGLYERLGCRLVGRDEDGTTHWELALPATVATPGLVAVERVVDLHGPAVPTARDQQGETVRSAR
ncbi:HAD-IIIC family phosphatase [Kineococcus aurantiacus]|uniref:FkbH-like protein n=1 Tax=Kineococcus aurantiacus TaxID=37633 RepID=A0A7Y9DNV4_9ACTN|nr:HAD-IIIC family phosphatase [Kineococcus aurantiacus]NYD23969.1 FkbH-like protein [Kineococcus aurantiacus]